MRALNRPPPGRPRTPALVPRALLAVVSVVLPGLGLLAGDQPPHSARHDVHDIRLALHIRGALAKDAELSRFDIYVSARQGNVTLWGRVPSDALAKRALQITKETQGVFQARSDLTIAPVEPNRDDATHSTAAKRPPSNRDPRPPGVLVGQPRQPRPSAQDAAWLGQPSHRRQADAAAPGATLLPPRAMAKEENLTAAVARLIQSDIRFSGVSGQERDGVITLSGRVSRHDHIMELARQASRLAGVIEVVVQNVRIIPP